MLPYDGMIRIRFKGFLSPSIHDTSRIGGPPALKSQGKTNAGQMQARMGCSKQENVAKPDKLE